MAESLESRKFERKQQFDLALPVRSKARETPEGGSEAAGDETGTMAFS